MRPGVEVSAAWCSTAPATRASPGPGAAALVTGTPELPFSDSTATEDGSPSRCTGIRRARLIEFVTIFWYHNEFPRCSP
uniref:Putative secreted protein n=1 Tax=Ixodes ricinus TaxID=34613 RepID=A0A6B0TV50_IXORI